MEQVRQPAKCAACPLQNRPGLRPLDARQLRYMEDFKAGEVVFARGEALVKQGQMLAQLYTLLSGVLMRFRTLEDGRRQIVNFMFPGDLVGLQAAFDEPVTHTIEAIIEARLCVFPRGDFARLIGEHPSLGYDLTWLAAKEETALEEHIVALGQRNARERVAYLAVWLLDRALATGLANSDNRLALPITQAQIADMLGLSLVHTNRTIGSLAREGLLIWQTREIVIPDMDRASEFAHFTRTNTRARPFI